jgi:flagellar hook-length control protein FliK
MTLLAAYIANLSGAAPVEGQKSTPVNALGVGGPFAALLEAAHALQVTDGENTPILTPFELPATPAGDPLATQASAESNALREALTQGLGLPQDGSEIDAAIIENPGDGTATSTSPVQISPAAVPDTDVQSQPPEDGQSPASAHQQTPVEPQVPAPAAPLPAIPARDASLLNTTAATPVPPVVQSVPAAGDELAAARPGTQQPGVPHQAPAIENSRPTGLDNAANKASPTAQERGLQIALNNAPNANGPAGSTGSQAEVQSASATKQGDGTRNPEQRHLDQRPATDIPAGVKQGDTRSEFSARGPQIVKTLVKPGSGQTLIRFQKFSAGDPTIATSPPTLTVNVQANAASPGLASANTPHVPVGALAVHIATQANNGARRFEIRLDPPELGRIDVRLNVSRDGQVMTHLVVERAETLELLQRDARQLERALQDAGLNTSEENMKFSLKDQALAQGGKDQAEGDEDFASLAESDDTDMPAVSNDPMPPPVRYMATSGLDIHI